MFRPQKVKCNFEFTYQYIDVFINVANCLIKFQLLYALAQMYFLLTPRIKRIFVVIKLLKIVNSLFCTQRLIYVGFTLHTFLYSHDKDCFNLVLQIKWSGRHVTSSWGNRQQTKYITPCNHRTVKSGYSGKLFRHLNLFVRTNSKSDPMAIGDSQR